MRSQIDKLTGTFERGAVNLSFDYIRMYPVLRLSSAVSLDAILTATVVTTVFIEIQKRNIDRIFEKQEKEMNKILGFKER